jgi:hypothetical protein
MMTMSKKTTLITSDDPKGQQFIALCRVAYNKAKLDDTRAQRLNEHGGDRQFGGTGGLFFGKIDHKPLNHKGADRTFNGSGDGVKKCPIRDILCT